MYTACKSIQLQCASVLFILNFVLCVDHVIPHIQTESCIFAYLTKATFKYHPTNSAKFVVLRHEGDNNFFCKRLHICALIHKVNSNTIKLTVHTSWYCVSDLLCVKCITSCFNIFNKPKLFYFLYLREEFCLEFFYPSSKILFSWLEH